MAQNAVIPHANNVILASVTAVISNAYDKSTRGDNSTQDGNSLDCNIVGNNSDTLDSNIVGNSLDSNTRKDNSSKGNNSQWYSNNY